MPKVRAGILKLWRAVRGDNAKGRKWLKKAVVCRKEILDPKVKETEGKLKKIKD